MITRPLAAVFSFVSVIFALAVSPCVAYGSAQPGADARGRTLAEASAPACRAGGVSAADRALILASDTDYRSALDCLDMARAAQPGTTPHEAIVFARARILAWSGAHDAAERLYDDLLARAPDNTDYQFGSAQLAYYRGDFDAASAQLRAVLERVPDYADAQDALNRVERARFADAPGVTDHNWRLDVGVEQSTFQRSVNEDWYAGFARFAYQGDRINIVGGVDHLRRFGLDDTSVTAGVSRRLANGWDASLTITGTPAADFRPQFGTDIEIGKTVYIGRGGRIALRPSVAARLDLFPGQSIRILRPGLVAFLPHDIRLEGRAIIITQTQASIQSGAFVRASLPAGRKFRLSVGVADAPETVNAIVIRTRSVFGGIAYAVTDTLSIQANYSRDDRENSFIRNTVGVSLTHRF